jgi:hypothetical protein
MRIITGAILIVGAIWLFTSALPYGNTYGGMPIMIKLAYIFAGLTAILGAFYLFVGSVEAKENARWYQFTIKSILAITLMVALFFSGRAMGLRESMSSPSFPAPYSSSSYSVAPTPVYIQPVAMPAEAVIESELKQTVELVSPTPSSAPSDSQTTPSNPPNKPVSSTP